MSSNQILTKAEKFLENGYTEVVPKSGRYVSLDGSRAFRMGVSDITGKHGGWPHVNFELLIPHPNKPYKMIVETNLHIYIDD